MQFLLISKQKQCEWVDECYKKDVNVMFTQISAKKELKRFKDQAVAAIVKQYKQLHDMNKFVIVCPEELTPKQKQDALRAITLINYKQSVKIKGIVCADGRSKRAYNTK